MNISIENIEAHIPYYLTEKAKNGLLKALKDFPNKMNYYTMYGKEDLLQGDGWDNLAVINFHSGDRKYIKGIIISNSCDIDIKNKRDLPHRIVFAPIVPLAAYTKLLASNGVEQESIDSKLRAITEQKVTSIFYLPKGGSLEEDHIALLDDIHNLPAQFFAATPDRNKQFTLSFEGFYIFLFKLSIHFCRFHEEELRGY